MIPSMTMFGDFFFYIFLSKNCLNFLKFQELVKVYQQERNSRLSRIRYG